MDKKSIHINSYVKLKKEFANTDMYRNVNAGATGWVRDRKVDFDGFDMIFIEWDELNPLYLGEQDKWVFESHFEVIEDQTDLNEKYIESVKRATDSALSADAYLSIALIKKTNKRTGMNYYEPVVHSAQLSKELVLMLEAQIAHMASKIFEAFVNDMTYSIEKDEDEPRR